MFRYSYMWILAIFFLGQSLVHADNVSMDEKRLRGFNAYVLKKEAYEEKRMENAGKEKTRRRAREERYDRARTSFKRPVVTTPPGQEQYARKMTELEKRYNEIRKNFAAKQRHLADRFHERIDRTKMIEYDIESASKESSAKE